MKRNSRLDDINFHFDAMNWMAQYLKISTVHGQIRPLVANIAQLKVHNTLLLQEKAGVGIRALILKARREGVSTYVAGRFFMECNILPNRTATVVSADAEATDKVFKMTTRFQDHMPPNFKRPTDYSSRKEIIYSAPHSSAIQCYTAGKEVLGRGGLTHYLHATEFAFWARAMEQFGGAVQEVPDGPGTMVIIESTANGVGGAFYDMYSQAVDDWKKSQDVRNYIPIFLPWFVFPDYTMEPEEGFETGKPHSEIVDQEWCEAEEELVRRFHCRPDQLMWRRWAIKNRCQGRLSLFQQEFPSNEEEAFVSSGRMVFSGAQIARQASKCKRPVLVLFQKNNEYYPVNSAFDSWQLVGEKRATYSYVMGVDCCEGKSVDSSDPKADSDYHGIVILCRDTSEVVAAYKGQCDQKTLGKQVLLAARYWNNAWINIELPTGAVLLEFLKENGYENIVRRRKGHEGLFTEETEEFGFKTTTTTRPILVKNVVSEIDHLTVGIDDIVSEMRTFVYNKEGKEIHQPGKHDDLLFGLFLAYYAHLHCPVDARWEDADFHTGIPPVAPEILELNRAYCIDPGVEYEREEYSWQTC